MDLRARIVPLAILLLACQSDSRAASWTQLTNNAPAPAGTMMLLTDGTVIVEEYDSIHWMKLTPDAQGSYINGAWTITSPMSTPRLYFASQVLPSGKVWVLGGEYSGTALVTNWTATGEIFDPVMNTWSAIAPMPNQPGCYPLYEFGGTISRGSPVIDNIVSTAGWQAGWSVSGFGIPASAVIASVDSPTQIHLSVNATSSNDVVMSLGAQATGNTTARSRIISGIASTAGYQAGWGISGAGIPLDAYIASVDSATQIHISQNATATGTGVALTFAIQFTPSACVGDDPSILLPGGKIMAGEIVNPGTYLYDITTGIWTPGANKAYFDTSSEEGWARLADGTVINYDIGPTEIANNGGGYAERYDPVANTWSAISPGDGTAQGVLPDLTTEASDELGPLIRLYDDRMFVIGANGLTALYTPSTNTWAAGPNVTGTLGGSPFLFGADDAPAAILPNGHVILAADAGNGIASSGTTTADSAVVTAIPSTAQLQVGWQVSGIGIPFDAVIKSVDSASQVTMSVDATTSNTGTALSFGGPYSPPTQLFDFDPATSLIAPVYPAIPDNYLTSTPSFATRMLMLPTGQLLFGDGSNQLWVYTPDGAANPALLPAIVGVSSNGDGSFTLSGTQLTGQSAGSAYGDDVQSDENYPIISLVNASGGVYYARTTNWSYIGVAGGSLAQTVDFTLNPQMLPGNYSLIVSGAGISSNPLAVTVGSGLTTITTSLKSQTITFGALTTQSAMSPPFTLNASASSGLSVTFTSNSPTVCTVSGTTVTLIAAGTCSITANQAGNSTWAMAIPVTQTFIVTATASTPQSIAFGPLSNVPYGTAPFAIVATASSGLTVSFTSATTGVCTISGNIVTIEAAGLCSITASQPGNSTWAAAPSITQTFTVSSGTAAVPQALQLITVAPCRIMDTRNPNGALGGPFIMGGTTRAIPVPSSACGIPANAAAYSLNFTVVPRAGALAYLSVWPAGQTQPLVSTLNSLDGSTIANAAIVPAGTAGAIEAYANNDTDLIVDINGYFVPPASNSLQFYPVTPCRILDTRTFGQPIVGGTSRAFAISSSSCGTLNNAAAFALNVTVVPQGALGYLTVWPTGQAQPLVSTLNSLDGTVLANAAIVPAGTGGLVSFYASNTTDVVVDINGYFAPPQSNGLNFYTLTPCRLVDTRNPSGTFGGPTMGPGTTRAFPLSQGPCGLPAVPGAQAYSLNMTVVPQGVLGYLSTWPAGTTQPVVSTLNAFKGQIVANAAIVPAGSAGSIDVYVTNTTDVIVDSNGYFGP